MDTINQLLHKTRHVLKKNALKNGAIVSAHQDFQHHKCIQNKHTVSVRDASFACLAADVLGFDDIPEKFFMWCLKKNADISKTGRIHTLYSTEGKRLIQGYQPDQAGLLLFAIWHHYKQTPHRAEKIKPLVRKLSDALCEDWKETHFSILAKDIWGEFHSFPQFEENFLYSLAACCRGLSCAHQFLHHDKYMRIAEQMKKQLDFPEMLTRSHGKHVHDAHVDASLLFIIYPLVIYHLPNKRLMQFVNTLESTLVKNNGVQRFEHDLYDGMMLQNVHVRKGGGSWPALNFLMAIYHAKTGERKKATPYYQFVLHHAEEYLPEQLFENKHQHAAQAHILSHALFVLATKELGYFILER
ncbi:MAG: glycoside hydrolase family 15 protein [archaeon]